MNNEEKLHSLGLSERDNSRCFEVSLNDMKVMGYLTLLNMANQYCRTSPRKLNQEIGLISADLIEPEFARTDRRNLIARKQLLENELKNIEKLKKLDEHEEHFIKHGKSYTSRMGISSEALLNHGVPYCTLEAAEII